MKTKMLIAALAAALTVGASTSCIKVYQTGDSSGNTADGNTSSFNGKRVYYNYNNGDSSPAFDEKAKKSVRKEVAVATFNKIDAAQNIQVICDHGFASGKAIIETTPEAEQYLDVEVVKGELRLHYSFPSGSQPRNIATTVRISTKSLTEVDLSSAASLTVNGSWKESGEIELDLSSAGSLVAGEITCTRLKIDATSASSFTASDVNGNLKVELTSAAKANIGTVNATKAYIETTSAANALINRLTATDVYADATSASTISINGLKCENLDIEATSCANVQANGSWKNISRTVSTQAKVTITKQ